MNLDRLRTERVHVEVNYHAAWTFSGLKGALGESWAHGPVFGAFGEVGTGQVNLTPPMPSDDPRITAVAGVKASGLLAEGPKWTAQAHSLAQAWIRDVYELLRPRRTVGIRCENFGLFPIRNAEVVNRRLIKRYFDEDEFNRVLGSSERQAFTALDMLTPASGDQPTISSVVGVVGPPHAGMFFQHPDEERDRAWWMGVRVTMFRRSEEGIEDPVEAVGSMISFCQKEYRRVATMTLPTLVE